MDLLRQIMYAQKDDFVIENHENGNVLLLLYLHFQLQSSTALSQPTVW